MGTINACDRTADGARLRVDATDWDHRPDSGDSISVDGCCLTVVANDDGMLAFDMVPMTLETTTLGDRGPGDTVNLEHAVTPTTLLGGHIVQGHVDGTGSVRSNEASGEDGWLLTIQVPGGTAHQMVRKGSITVDGVSLTVAELEGDMLTIALVPETLSRTTLGDRGPGDTVNLEFDCLLKMVEALLGSGRSTIP